MGLSRRTIPIHRPDEHAPMAMTQGRFEIVDKPSPARGPINRPTMHHLDATLGIPQNPGEPFASQGSKTFLPGKIPRHRNLERNEKTVGALFPLLQQLGQTRENRLGGIALNRPGTPAAM